MHDYVAIPNNTERRPSRRRPVILMFLAAICAIGIWLGWSYWDLLQHLRQERLRPLTPPVRPPVAPVADDLICRIVNGLEDCYPKVFVPTHEFQPIREGQQVPKGLHIKIDMDTHVKLAKFVDPQEHSNENAVAIAVPERSSLPSPPPPSKPNPGLSTAVRAEFDEHLQSVLTEATRKIASETPKSLLLSLDRLAELVAETEFGETFARRDGFRSMMQLMDSQRSSKVTKLAALVLGNAFQNNPVAKHRALEQGMLDELVNRIQAESAPAVLNRLVYALSTLVRGDPLAIELFTNHAGIHILAQLYDTTPDVSLQRRCATLISDMFNPQMVSAPAQIDDTAGTRHDMHHWCWNMGSSLLAAQQGLGANDVDWKSTLVRGITNVKYMFPKSCSLRCDSSYADMRTPCPFLGLKDVVQAEKSKYAEDPIYSDYLVALKAIEAVV
ncbi:nucleotide exchange factor sil1 [Dimargaris cristalligena]|nr:nucleotide exchange factor sil1 [Dimargaris cristalligena]